MNNKKENKIKKDLIKYGAGLIALFVIIFVITRILLNGGIKIKEIDLPNLEGKTQAEVEEILKAKKLNLKIGEEEASSDIEKGKVVSQELPYLIGKKIKEGESIIIHLSSGPEEIELQKWIGENIEDVRKEAKKLGLKLEEKFDFNDKIEKDLIVSQEPKEKTLVKSGDTITLVISKGIEQVKVPTVVDMDEGTAKATLKNKKLKTIVKYVSDVNKPNGKVISQKIAEGTEVNVNSEIEITVNKIVINESYVKTINLKLDGTVKNGGTLEVDITMLVNGSKKIDGKKVTIGKGEIDLGKIKGEGLQRVSIVAKDKNGVEYNIASEKFNLDDYTDGGTKYIKYTFNK